MIVMIISVILMSGIYSQKAEAVNDLCIVTTSPLPDGQVGVPYTAKLTAADNSGNCLWTIVAGSLPTGLELKDFISGRHENTDITGTPTVAGTYTFTVEVADNSGYPNTKPFTITIKDSSSADVPSTPKATASSCSHDYEWTTINDASEDYDGLEVCRCTKCGAVCDSRSIPKLSDNINYVTEKYIGQYEQAKSGQTIKLDLKSWNSMPKAFFEELAKKRDITTTIRFLYNHKIYEFTIARDQAVDTSLEWYGPEKLIELYGAKEVVTK